MNSSRPPTLQDVADRAGVSRALVSIVIRDVPGASAETRARVLRVAAELGYRPDHRARLLAGRRTKLLGVTLSLPNPFHADLVEAIYPAADALGYQVVLSAITAGRAPRIAIDTLLAYRCEAAVLIGPLLPAGPLSVLADRTTGRRAGSAGPGRRGGRGQRADDRAGLALAVEHLVGLGHRRIWHLDGGRGPAATERRNGYQAALRRAGLAEEITVIPSGATEQDGADAAARLMADGLPEAVITYNDRSAVGLLDRLARAGVDVPGQLSVVGYDDSQVARLPYLQLTTVSQDANQLAEHAVRRAVARIEGTLTRRSRSFSPGWSSAPQRHPAEGSRSRRQRCRRPGKSIARRRLGRRGEADGCWDAGGRAANSSAVRIARAAR